MASFYVLMFIIYIIYIYEYSSKRSMFLQVGMTASPDHLFMAFLINENYNKINVLVFLSSYCISLIGNVSLAPFPSCRL